MLVYLWRLLTNMFTETLNEFLQDRELSAEWQALKTLFDKMPSFNLNIDDPEAEADNINFYDLFKLEYGNREIGQEYENIFFSELKRQLTKVLIEYKPKIEEYFKNFRDLMNPLVELEETTNTEGASENFVYLHPINSTTRKMQSSDKNEGTGTSTRNYQQQMTYNDTKTKIIAEFLELKNIYLSALADLDSCFMQLY